jgi:hypothetical protein
MGCASGPEVFSTVPPVASGTNAANEIESTLILLGDAGWALADDPVLARVTEHASERPDRTVVVFLGDNVYPDGLAPEGYPDRKRGEDILLAQIAIGQKSGARLIFVPGNHDWDTGRDDGFDEVLGQGQFIEAHGAEILPTGGCPGPSVVDAGSQVRLVALDTQWWLQDGVKPRDPTSTCPADSEAEVLDALGMALEEASNRHLVVVAHHPLVSRGPHAGHFTWKDHIFPLTNLAGWMWLPLPIVGSIYPLARGAGITSQDLSNSGNEHMRAALDSVFAIHRPLIYAAGHDHSLQVLEGETARYFLVSGASTVGHFSRVGRLDQTLYAKAGTGFMRIDFTRGGEARLAVVAVDEDGTAVEEYSAWLQ